MTQDIRLSENTAKWLLQFGTRLVREGFGTNWMPIFGNSPLGERQEYAHFEAIQRDPDMPTAIKTWIAGLMMVAKTVASMIAFQYEPQEIPPMLENINEVDFEVDGYEADNLPLADITNMNFDDIPLIDD